jgi:hypothetical protein
MTSVVGAGFMMQMKVLIKSTSVVALVLMWHIALSNLKTTAT